MPEPIINMPKKDNNITDKLPKLDPIVETVKSIKTSWWKCLLSIGMVK